MVTVEPFNWREIIKVLLDAGGIVKAVDEGENALRRFLPGAEPAWKLGWLHNSFLRIE